MLPFAGYVDQARIPHLVAQILNGRPDSQLPEHIGTWLVENPTGKHGKYGEAMQEAKLHLRLTLRQLVDQWIDSGHGFVPDVIEVPKARNLFKRPERNLALANFLSERSKRNPPTVGTLSGHPGIPGRIEEQPVMYLQINPPGLDKRLPAPMGGIKWGQELAGYWLRRHHCPTQKRFARCTEPGCGRYFVYDRAKRERYQTYCPRHKGNRAKARVEAANERKHARRINAAAKHWSEWRPDYGERSVWVAEKAQSEKELRLNDRFTRRFVTTYAAEIEEASEGGSNATRKN